MKKTKIDNQLYRLTLEKMVIGLEEPILIKGVGEIIAKVDSGNAGYNVIHGEDLTVQGDILTFKTQNKNGDDRRVSKKIKKKLNVNIGGGHIQERPVVELDVQIGGQEYKKILFSVTDRSSNDNKVLISADFVGKELDALIDVSKTKIADDNINVDYVTEGLLANAYNKVKDKTSQAKQKIKDKIKDGAQAVADFGKKIDNKTGNVVSDTYKGAKAVASGAMNAVGTVGRAAGAVTDAYGKFNRGMTKFGQKVEDWGAWAFGDPKVGKADPKLAKNISEEIDSISKIENLRQEDSVLIKKILPTFQEIQNSSADINSAAVSKLLDYAGGGPDSSKSYPPEYKELLKKALHVAQKLVKKSQGSFAELTGADKKAKGLRTESTILNTLNLLFEDTPPNLPPIPDKPETNDKEEQNDNKDESQQKDVSEMDGGELQAIFDDLKKRNKAIFYIVNFTKDKNGGELINAEDIWKKYNNIVDSALQKLAAAKQYSLPAFKTAAADLAAAFNKVKDEPKMVGCFALCTGPLGARKCEIIAGEKLMYDTAGLGTKATAEAEVRKKIMDQGKKLYLEFCELCDIINHPELKEWFTLDGIKELMKFVKQPPKKNEK